VRYIINDVTAWPPLEAGTATVGHNSAVHDWSDSHGGWSESIYGA
jgi:hypothetical protein